MAMNEPIQRTARPPLNAFDIGCVVVGGIIGVGIFFTPGRVAASVDSAGQMMLAWALGGVLAILGALVFAALARVIPGYGGTFVYLQKAFGSLPAFLYGWCNWLVIQAGALGVIGLVMVDHAAKVVHGAKAQVGGDSRILLAVFAILVFTALNCLGLRVGKLVQNTLTVGKTLAVFVLVLLVAYAEGPAVPHATAVQEPAGRGLLWALGGAMLPVLFSFGGWQQGAFVAGGARVPARDVPLGILAGVAVVVVAYLTINLAFLNLLGFERAAATETIALDALHVALEGSVAAETVVRLLAAAVTVSALGIMNTICMAPPFVLHAMAQQGLFLRSAARLHPVSQSPVVAVLAQGLFGAVLLVTVHLWTGGDSLDTLDALLSGVVFVDWICFFGCGAALFVLARRGEKVPAGASTIAVLFALASLAVVSGAIWTRPWSSLAGLAVLAIGLLVYLWIQARRPPGAIKP